MTDYEKEQIITMRSQGIGYVKIGLSLGISNNTVRSFCRRNGLDGNAEKTALRCKQCGKSIKEKSKCKPRIFCSDACRIDWWNSHLDCVNRKAVYQFVCAACGKPFTAYGNQNRKYCCHSCYIADRFGKECGSNE